MKKLCLSYFLIFFLTLLSVSQVLAHDIDPIVSTEWLAANLNNPKLVTIDIRKIEDYREGHIPGASLRSRATGTNFRRNSEAGIVSS
jgi:hypothetical protein